MRPPLLDLFERLQLCVLCRAWSLSLLTSCACLRGGTGPDGFLRVNADTQRFQQKRQWWHSPHKCRPPMRSCTKGRNCRGRALHMEPHKKTYWQRSRATTSPFRAAPASASNSSSSNLGTCFSKQQQRTSISGALMNKQTSCPVFFLRFLTAPP